MKKLIFLAVLVALVAVSQVYAQPTQRRPVGETVVGPNIKSETYVVYWRNAANPDTTIRLFTAAAQLNDTSRDAYWVGGANTISIVDSFAVKEDSALVRVFVQFSNDKQAWFRHLAGTGVDGGTTPIAHSEAAMAALDSSGALDTPDANDFFIRGNNLATPPTWANWMRVIAAKYLSAATDTMILRTTVSVHFGDE